MAIKIHKMTIAVILLILGPSACENCPDTPKYFTIVGLETSNAKFTGEGSNPWQILAANEPVSWENYFMRIGFEKTYFSQNENSAGSALKADCLSGGYLGAKVGVDTLYVVTLSEYNQDFHANDTINSIVLANDWTYYVEDFDQFYSISDYIDQNRVVIANDVFELKIIEPPSADSADYQFRLTFILNNGETFTTDTDMVKLTK
jgi:hypothetical protein